jgi:hypothetical protein
MKRRLLLPLLALTLLVPAALIAADALETYGLDRVQVENSTLGAFNGWYSAPDMKALKALPPGERAAAVTALGGFLKEYVQSGSFRAEYAKAYKNSKPKGGGLLASLNTRSLLAKGTDKVMGRQAESNPNALDKDPDVTLRKRLRSFLDATRDVDFEAETRGTGGSRRFVLPTDEARPPEWKMCFRAGPEATGAARSFAQKWLDELGPAR